MSGYRFEIVEHDGIPCVKVEIDDNVQQTVSVAHIPLEDIQRAIDTEIAQTLETLFTKNKQE